MRVIRSMLLAAIMSLIAATPATAQTYPKFTGLVVDAADVLPPETEADLTAKLQAVQRDTKRQLVVATIADLEGRELPEYGVGLLRAWGVGLKGVDNGAILFIAPNEPKGHRGPRLAVGYGLEPVLTDAFAGSVIRSQMMPKLTQTGDIPGAMEAGTDALIAQLRASPDEAKARTDAAVAEFDQSHRTMPSSGGSDGFPIGLIFFGFIAMFVLLSFTRRAGGRHYQSSGGGPGGGDGGGLLPVILWGLASGIGRDSSGSGWSGSSGGGSWGGGGGSDGDSGGGWGGGGFSGGGGGDTGGGGASGSW